MGKGLRILIVDDSEQEALSIVNEIKQAGLLGEWQRVEDEESFIKALNGQPDLILSDYALRSFTGSKALKILRQKNLDIPFIIVTDSGNEEIAVECLKQGAADYVVKRNLSRLPTCVRSALEQAEKSKTQEKMSKALRLTKFALDFASISIYWLSVKGNFIWANEAGLNAVGYTFDELRQKKIDTIDPTLSRHGWKKFCDSLRQNRSMLLEGQHRHKDGHLFPVEITATYLNFEGVEYIFVFSRNISKRKQAEVERDRLFAAIEQATESVVVTDSNGYILYVNPAFERISGYNKDEVIGKNPRILKSGVHDTKFYNNMWKALTSGKSWHGHLVNRRKDGTLFEEDATISPIRDKSGKIISYVAVKRDITQEVLMEKQFRLSQKLEAVGRLAGGVAHDFNNILTIINGYSELLMKIVDDKDPLRTHLEQITRASKRASSLTKQLLAFSRRQPLEPRILDLNAIVNEMLTLLRRLLGEDIEVIMELDESIANIKADPGQIEQIIVNLAANARDAMPQGGKLLIKTFGTTLDQQYCDSHIGMLPGEYAVLSITDSGIGMTEAVRSKIFEPFYTTKESGSGLGLSTVFGIVKQSGGHIECLSKIGEGSTFNIFFPAVQGKAEPVKKKVEIVDLPGGDETILLVEDDDEVRTLTARMLKLQGYRVIEALNCKSALAMCRKYKENLDLLLTDVVMPQMRGPELAQKAKAVIPNLQVLFMSGYTDGFALSDNQPGEYHFLNKPFTLEEISFKVRQVLDARQKRARILRPRKNPSPRLVSARGRG